MRHCLNCAAVLTGRYCANCGQIADVHVPSTQELIHEALEGITHSDSRLWRTLCLLWFKPGKLTQEFVAGRRAAYLPPFRLYLILSILFFLSASLSTTQVKFVRLDAVRSGAVTAATAATAATATPAECDKLDRVAFKVNVLGRDWAPRIKHACGEIARDSGANLFHVFLGTAPKAMFIFLPLIAFLHMLLYWRPHYRYAVHLLFFLHLHAFFFSVMTLAMLLPLLLWSLPVHTVLAMRRVFGGGWGRTLAKASVLFAAYLVVLSITAAGVFVYAVLQL